MPPDVLNKDALLARVGGDAALLGAMAALFLEECPAHLAGIRAAVAGHDARALERTAHALKGAVSNFKALAAEHAAQILEQMGRAGNLDGAERALVDLERAVERLAPVLEKLR
jgi:HPt (histidine-containing phosphotransfer) domain-containing protein